MKKLSIIFAMFLFTAILMGCDNSDDVAAPDNSSSVLYDMQGTIDSLPMEDLSEAEIEGLTIMREEEKLARDVYIYFYNKYGMRIFNNISNSEEKHTSAIKALLDKYSLEDPVIDDTPGVFQNEDLGALYTQLTAAGDASLLEALKVGATIEDLDIKDLMDYEDEVDNQDIIFVYDNLTRGSRNHLRSYYSQILNNGGTYDPQYISQELFDYIVNSPKETGRP
ncbi:MAG: DUF2202 domain-containing protein [Chlorobi bacterium]|nr:DUF2202 domain-containing protein [Chlorobiota bacterium]